MIAHVLSRHGSAVTINIGIDRPKDDAKGSGHCWLTTQDGNIFMESVKIQKEYPQFLEEGRNRIKFWLGT